MHQFFCEVDGNDFVPIDSKKRELLNKIKKDYKNRNMTVKVTLEIVQKQINTEQEKLYKAFILKAADHFGTDFLYMANLLIGFAPDKPTSRWTTAELNKFIDQASAHLAEFGFHF
jgi:translation initiation factor 2 alpha subunit (eIF-2alpha)